MIPFPFRKKAEAEQAHFIPLLTSYPHQYGIICAIDPVYGDQYVAYRRTGAKHVVSTELRASYRDAKADMDRWYAEDAEAARKGGAA